MSVLDPGVLRGVTARRLSTALRGRRFEEPHRHGKWLLTPAQGPVVLLHFGMTGSLTWHRPDEPRHRHDRVVWELPDGELRYRDMRKLQGVRLTATTKEADETLATLGPDALDLSRDDLTAALTHHRGRLKTTSRTRRPSPAWATSWPTKSAGEPASTPYAPPAT
ncbi:DNA-formamidopyrimidine glycosylase family protein [Actinomadura citrea]|uniref:DNA-formamidopyrimidine glycosylase family protein n=1 Tax=Actinomadura citrea TaxID=46158 RepID=UPI003CE46889